MAWEWARTERLNKREEKIKRQQWIEGQFHGRYDKLFDKAFGTEKGAYLTLLKRPETKSQLTTGKTELEMEIEERPGIAASAVIPKSKLETKAGENLRRMKNNLTSLALDYFADDSIFDSKNLDWWLMGEVENARKWGAELLIDFKDLRAAFVTGGMKGDKIIPEALFERAVDCLTDLEKGVGKVERPGFVREMMTELLAAFDLLEPETKELILTNLGGQLGLGNGATPKKFKEAAEEKAEEMTRVGKMGGT